MIRLLIVFPLVLMVKQTNPSFKDTQLKNNRVKIAYEEKEGVTKGYFRDMKLNYSNFQLFIRAFKKEQKLEVWVSPRSGEEKNNTYTLLHTYDFCATSGTLGPKRKEGDSQIPEGIYQITHFNPQSNFYLSLGINYPNASDKILSDPAHPGGNIYIHGNCVTIGCIPITDDKIKELYVLAVEARNNGQEKIPVHIFPDRLESGVVEKLVEEYPADQTLINFWKNLQVVYLDFKTTNKLKVVKANKEGRYYF